MYSSKVEEEILSMLHELEAEQVDAERRLEIARTNLLAKEQQVASVRFALERYREKYGIPVEPIESPVREAEYAHLGPVGMVDHWANKHGGDVIVRDLVQELLRAKAYPIYRKAYSVIYPTLLKSKRYEKIGPGCFRKVEPATIQHNGHHPSMSLVQEEIQGLG